MTQAILATLPINKTPNTIYSHSSFFVERRQAIRSAIVGARPVMPDDYSRLSKLRMARKIWNQSLPISGSIVETYFRQYGFVYEPESMGQVRFNPVVLHEPTREHFPALIAPVHNLEGEFVGIHKTYLAADGTGEAKVQRDARRMLGKCQGSYIQLSKAIGFRLVITESLEMGLAIQQACPGFPVWVAMTPANMRSPVPPCVKEIIMCADGHSKNKEVNQKLVHEAVREHMDRGVGVSLAPCLPGMNFAQIL